MKTITIIILSLMIVLSCSRKRNIQDEKNKSVVITSTLQAETPARQKNIAVIYNSTDGGINWVPFDNGIPPDATVSAFLVTDGNILASTDTNGIYSVKDGQSEWQRIDENLPPDIDINTISIIRNVLIIGTFRHGILISKDYGKSWIYPVNNINSPVRCLYAKENILFAGADDGIYKSADSGNTWEHIRKGVQVNGFTELNNDIYAALMNGAVKTSDNGQNWEYVYKPHTLHDISSDGQSIYAMTLGAGLRKSDNAGMTWRDANFGMGTTNLYTFEVKKYSTRLYAAQWYGIYTSDNQGLSWRLIKDGLPDSTAFSTLETTKRGLIAGIGLRKKTKP